MIPKLISLLNTLHSTAIVSSRFSVFFLAQGLRIVVIIDTGGQDGLQ